MASEQYCWFFAYGSLMWKPGFDHIDMIPATLPGWDRALCVYSWVWRGTQEKPGLVMGLAPGTGCDGLAIRGHVGDEPKILRYLDARELVTDVYVRHKLPLALDDGRTVQAWCYVVRNDHPQFACGLDHAQMAAIIRQGHGRGGANTDYLRATLDRLRSLGIAEPDLEKIADLL